MSFSGNEVTKLEAEEFIKWFILNSAELKENYKKANEIFKNTYKEHKSLSNEKRVEIVKNLNIKTKKILTWN
jgi:hypothetical protein